MRITNSLDSYPVFPDWVFTGELQLNDDQVEKIIAELNQLGLTDMPYGKMSTKNKIGNASLAFNRLVGASFFDNIVAQYRIPKELQNIESVDPQFHLIEPGKQIPPTVIRHRWYTGAVFLSSEPNGSDVYLERFDSRLYSTPKDIQDYTHIIKSGRFKMAFWPAYIPWGFTTNNSSGHNLIYTTSFILKRG